MVRKVGKYLLRWKKTWSAPQAIIPPWGLCDWDDDGDADGEGDGDGEDGGHGHGDGHGDSRDNNNDQISDLDQADCTRCPNNCCQIWMSHGSVWSRHCDCCHKPDDDDDGVDEVDVDDEH